MHRPIVEGNLISNKRCKIMVNNENTLIFLQTYSVMDALTAKMVQMREIAVKTIKFIINSSNY